MLSTPPFLSFHSPPSKEFLPQSPWTPTANYLRFALSCIMLDFLMNLWPSVNKEKLKDKVRTANKSTCISKLRLSLSREVNSSDQVKFSSACPTQSKCCERTFHTPPHSMSPHKREKNPSFNTGQCTVHLSGRFWFARTDCNKSMFKMKMTSKGATCTGWHQFSMISCALCCIFRYPT